MQDKGRGIVTGVFVAHANVGRPNELIPATMFGSLRTFGFPREKAVSRLIEGSEGCNEILYPSSSKEASSVPLRGPGRLIGYPQEAAPFLEMLPPVCTDSSQMERGIIYPGTISKGIEETPSSIPSGEQSHSDYRECQDTSKMVDSNFNLSNQLIFSLQQDPSLSSIRLTGPQAFESSHHLRQTLLETEHRLPNSEILTLVNETLLPENEVSSEHASDLPTPSQSENPQPFDAISSKPTWSGLEVPYRCIAARYNIRWDTPLGRGTYGNVLEVLHL